ncbi:MULTISPECIES: DUF7373 family lipoprotein [Nocardia]|uniref:DUF7373 family lipoprotein n=1 Tax=Nocardia TaxID=1817 RepID=UPI002930D20F|nr:hypothetical protein [Nocardia canadensis]
MTTESSWLKVGLRAALVVGIVTTASTGCGSEITGNPVPGATGVDSNFLRTGPFQTEPIAFEIESGARGPEQVRLVEGRRLLNFLAHPIDIDPDLKVPGRTRIFGDQNAVPTVGGIHDEHLRVFKDSVEFVTGVSTSQSNGSVRSPKSISIAVLRFASDTVSARTTEELDRITMASNPRRVDTPRYPTAKSSTSDDKTIVTWLAHGPYIVMTEVRTSTPGTEKLAISVEDTLGMQVRSLDQQNPIPLDDVLDQPLDPENLVRRTMVRDQKRDSSQSDEDYGYFQPAGMLHFERNPAEARKKFEETGVDLIARRGSTVYRTKDLASSFQLQTFLSRRGKNDVALEPPPGIADAQCLRLDTPDPSRNYDLMCAVVYDRYVAVVAQTSFYSTAQVDHSLQERTAAQYAILKKCE